MSGLTIMSMGGQSAAQLTPKGVVKLRLGSVAWIECLEVLNAWQFIVNAKTHQGTELMSFNAKWFQRLGLLLDLIGVGGQLETAASRTLAGAVPTEVTLKLTMLEAVTLLDLWWTMPVEMAKYASFAVAIGDLHKLLQNAS